MSNYVPSSNTIKFYDVVGVILSEEMRRKIIGETSVNAITMERRGRKRKYDTSSNVLSMESKGRQKERGKIPGNHGNSRKGRSKSRLGKIECLNYGKKGYMNKYCKCLKKKGDGQQETS